MLTEPTGYNPNILLRMAGRPAQGFVDRYRPYGEEGAAIKAQAHLFEQRYHEALAAVQSMDKRGRLQKTFGVVPLTPRFDLTLGDEQPHVLGTDALGGFPDFRDHYGLHVPWQQGKRSPEDLVELIRKEWPKDAHGYPMTYVGQLTLHGWKEVVHYFHREDEEYGWSRSCFGLIQFTHLSVPTRYTVFRASQEDFDSSNMDCFMFERPVYPREVLYYGREPDTVPDDLYLEAVTVAFPEHAVEDEADGYYRTWGTTSQPFMRCDLGFDLYVEFSEGSYGYAGYPECAKFNSDLYETLFYQRNWQEGTPLAYDWKAVHLLGRPRGQQTLKRWLDPRSMFRPARMNPFLHWHVEHHDMDYQLSFGMTTQRSIPGYWGKMDQSCT